MSNIENATDHDQIEQVQVAQETAPEVSTESHAPEKRESISLDDAFAKAVAMHSPSDKEDDAPKGALPNTPPVAVAPGKTVDPVTGREQEPIKAPVGWTPTLREKWNSIDPTVQKFIVDRERDMAQNFSKSADDRKLAFEVKQAFAPYESTLRQYNVSGTALAKDLMAQWHVLATGDGVAKAQVIAGLLNHFRPDAQALQQLLSGGQVQSRPAQTQVDVDKLVAERVAARDQASAEAAVGKDIEAFQSDPANEFFNDVHPLMSKILSAELVDAPTMPELLKKAYDLACTQHPEVKDILDRRAAASSSPAVPAAVAKPKPVGSVKPTLNNGNRGSAPKRSVSLDDAVNEAFRLHAKE